MIFLDAWISWIPEVYLLKYVKWDFSNITSNWHNICNDWFGKLAWYRKISGKCRFYGEKY